MRPPLTQRHVETTEQNKHNCAVRSFATFYIRSTRGAGNKGSRGEEESLCLPGGGQAAQWEMADG